MQIINVFFLRNVFVLPIRVSSSIIVSSTVRHVFVILVSKCCFMYDRNKGWGLA